VRIARGRDVGGESVECALEVRGRIEQRDAVAELT
jgi:hypothetical protein